MKFLFVALFALFSSHAFAEGITGYNCFRPAGVKDKHLYRICVGANERYILHWPRENPAARVRVDLRPYTGTQTSRPAGTYWESDEFFINPRIYGGPGDFQFGFLIRVKKGKGDFVERPYNSMAGECPEIVKDGCN